MLGRKRGQILISPGDLKRERLECESGGNPFRQEDAARLIGVSQRTWSNWETGAMVMSAEKLALWHERSDRYRSFDWVLGKRVERRPPIVLPSPWEMPIDPWVNRTKVEAGEPPAPSPDPPGDPAERAAWEARLAEELLALQAAQRAIDEDRDTNQETPE